MVSARSSCRCRCTWPSKCSSTSSSCCARNMRLPFRGPDPGGGIGGGESYETLLVGSMWVGSVPEKSGPFWLRGGLPSYPLKWNLTGGGRGTWLVRIVLSKGAKTLVASMFSGPWVCPWPSARHDRFAKLLRVALIRQLLTGGLGSLNN